MRFEVYCDENHPDLLSSSKKSGVDFMTIGSLWLPADSREDMKKKINAIRKNHKKFGEIKWTKVSPSSLDFYKELVDLFLAYGEEVRFRCIAVAADDINWEFHDKDRELGFYKFYYQMLHHWILDFNEYTIFCDYKTIRAKGKLQTLKRCLSYANFSSEILQVQALYSKDVVLIQLADLLLGAVSARLNNTIEKGRAKDEFIEHLERRLGVNTLCPTAKSQQKFNIFKINLKGGW